MNVEMILPWVVRWVHIACATVAIGVPFFVWLVLTPAAGKVLTEEQHQKLRERINARWRVVVYVVITLFIVKGFVQFFVPMRVNGVLVTARWRDFTEADKKVYHMIFGIKMLGAFGMFFLASALAGRTKTFAPIRAKRKVFLGVLLVLAVVVLTCATLMKYLPGGSGGVAAPAAVGGALP